MAEFPVIPVKIQFIFDKKMQRLPGVSHVKISHSGIKGAFCWLIYKNVCCKYKYVLVLQHTESEDQISPWPAQPAIIPQSGKQERADGYVQDPEERMS